MTKLEFQDLQQRLKSSGMTLKSFLQSDCIAYSTHNYWRKKCEEESRDLPIAPISIRETRHSVNEPLMQGVEVPGVTLAFPNGLRAHFGRGSEGVLMEVLSQSLSDHVLP